MLVFRTLGLLLLLSIALCVAAGVLTGRRHYMRWAGLLLRIGVAVAVVFAALFLLERLLAPVL
jgi:hypothetical protein